MPGVPSGRGCGACRKQKKKCDQIKPSCSRCVRLQIDCVGGGERRFKFVKDVKFAKKSFDSESSCESEYLVESQIDFSRSLPPTPSSASTGLIVGLIERFHESYDLRYHLSWTYGDFLEEIPRRIGTSKALDASVAALISAHSHLSSSWTVMTRPESLSKYNHALKTLRTTLNDPREARRPETLGACYLLLISQGFIDTYTNSCSSHTEGATQILKARGYIQSDDIFEQKLLLSLRGPVLVEALLSDRIRFSHDEWKDLVVGSTSLTFSTTPEARMMHCWTAMPDLIRRGKLALKEHEDRQIFIIEARQEYQTIMQLLTVFKTRYDTFRAHPISPIPTISAEKISHNFQRIYGLCLGVCLLSNCITSGIDTTTADLETDSYDLCCQVLAVAREATIYRPLGASYITLCLIAAWCSSMDATMKSALEDMIMDYERDFPRRTVLETQQDFLEVTSRRLRLLDSKGPVAL